MNNNIEINVHVNNVDELKNLSVSLRRMIASIQDSTNATKVLDARQRGLNAALGITSRGMGDHAKSLRQVASNQAALGDEVKRLTADLKNLNKIASGKGFKTLQGDLDKTARAMKKIKARALVSDLRSVGQEMKRLGKDAQFVGRSLIIGLTTPIIAFGRKGIQAFAAVDKALVRIEKITDRSRDKFTELTAAVKDMSSQFGIAHDLLLQILEILLS